MLRRAAVIGAGLAGLACAGRLHRAGIAVTVFDKGRRPGGRVATRRVGALQFEHGARYVTARTLSFRAMLEAAGEQAAVWHTGHDELWWIGVPAMSALAQAMVMAGVGKVMARTHVLFLHRDLQGWHVRHADAAATSPGTVAPDGGALSGPFDAVILALPAPQAASLLHGMDHAFASRTAAVTMTPCWTYMLAYDGAHAGPDRPACDGVVLDWLSRDSARPGRSALPECWVAHAGLAWSLAHVDHPGEVVQPLLHAAFVGMTGIKSMPTFAAVHRWRYAFVRSPLGVPFLLGPDRLALCGDWCLGPDAEAAFQSGEAAAEAVMEG